MTDDTNSTTDSATDGVDGVDGVASALCGAASPASRCEVGGARVGPVACAARVPFGCWWRARVSDAVETLVGDNLVTLARAAEDPSNHGTVQCVVTSPPYHGLRSYGVPPSVWPEVTFVPAVGLAPITIPAMVCPLGLEADLWAFVGHIVHVFRLLRPLLRADGVMWVDFGDSYATGTNAPREPSRVPADPGGMAPAGWTNRSQGVRCSPVGLAAKQLAMQPYRVALALQGDGWWVRDDVVIHTTNPLPESITDRPVRAHRFLYLVTKSPTYFYDGTDIREPCATPAGEGARNRARRTGGRGREDHRGSSVAWVSGGQGRAARDVWSMPSQPFKGAHFATFAEPLARRAILAGTSARGCCPTCHAPWERVTEEAYENPGNRTTNGPRSLDNRAITAGFTRRLVKTVRTVGWKPGCACPAHDPVPCLVLDPYGGSGTTGEAAENTGRRALLCELNTGYLGLQHRRLAEAAARREAERARAAKPATARRTRPTREAPSVGSVELVEPADAPARGVGEGEQLDAVQPIRVAAADYGPLLGGGAR